MHAASFAFRRKLHTLDYSDDTRDDEVTELVLPLTRPKRLVASRVVAPAVYRRALPAASRVVAAPRVVDEISRRRFRAVQQAMMALPAWDAIVLEVRVADQRRARQRSWLLRIALVAAIELVVAMARNPTVVAAVGVARVTAIGWVFAAR